MQPPPNGTLVASSGWDLIRRGTPVAVPLLGDFELAPTDLGLGLVLALLVLAYWYRRIL